MKKAVFSLFLVSLLLAIFLAGLAFGRNARADPVTITYFAPAATSQQPPVTTGTHPASPSQPESASTGAQHTVDINTADAAELEQLPGIGSVLAQRIVEYRAVHGPFDSLEALLNVSGIGEKKLESLRDFASVGGAQS